MMKENDRPAADFRVTLLGTGGPDLTPDRTGAAVLLEIGSELLLFDTGRSVTQRLYEVGIELSRITRIFFTHLHSDHIEGLPQLWMTSWFLSGRKSPMEVWGPVGTRDMLAFNEAAASLKRELEATGVPRWDIDAGYALDGWDLYAHPENLAPGSDRHYQVPYVTSEGPTHYSITNSPLPNSGRFTRSPGLVNRNWKIMSRM